MSSTTRPSSLAKAGLFSELGTAVSLMVFVLVGLAGYRPLRDIHALDELISRGRGHYIECRSE